MELCSMLFGSLDGRGVWGRMDTCIRMMKSLCCSSETVTALFIASTPIQSKVKKKKKKLETDLWTENTHMVTKGEKREGNKLRVWD